MAMTSRMSSTTQTMVRSRLGLLQISQHSASEILWHWRQYRICPRRACRASVRRWVCEAGCRSRCRASLRAVLLPIPGSRETSSTAFSSSLDVISINAKLRTRLEFSLFRREFKILSPNAGMFEPRGSATGRKKDESGALKDKFKADGENPGRVLPSIFSFVLWIPN